MKLNLPPKLRLFLYIFVVIGTSIIVPLGANQVISDVIVSVWASFSAAVSALAAFNVDTKE